MHSCTTQGDYISDGGESNRKNKSGWKKTTVFRESVDESMTMNKPHWRGRKYDI